MLHPVRAAVVNAADKALDQGLSASVFEQAMASEPALQAALGQYGIAGLSGLARGWRNLPADTVTEVYAALIDRARAPYQGLAQELAEHHPQSQQGYRYSEAILAIAPYIPPWDNALPDGQRRLRNGLAGIGIKYFRDFEGVTPARLVRADHLGVKSFRLLFDLLMRYQVPRPIPESVRQLVRPSARLAPIESQPVITPASGAALTPDVMIPERPVSALTSLAAVLTLALDEISACEASAAEQEVIGIVKDVLGGDSRAEIARHRGVRRHTLDGMIRAGLSSLAEKLAAPRRATLVPLRTFIANMEAPARHPALITDQAAEQSAFRRHLLSQAGLRVSPGNLKVMNQLFRLLPLSLDIRQSESQWHWVLIYD